MRERLTILVIVGRRTDEHSLRSQVGIGSESRRLSVVKSDQRQQTVVDTTERGIWGCRAVETLVRVGHHSLYLTRYG